MFRFHLIILIAVLGWPSVALAEGEITPVTSYTWTLARRTLFGLPSKGIITDEAGWRRVTRELSDVPAAPAFDKGHVCAVVVVDISGGAKASCNGVKSRKPGEFSVDMTRTEETERTLIPRIKAFLWVLPSPLQGVRLRYRTALRNDGGNLERVFPAVPADLLRRGLPRLGPDLRLSVVMSDGSKPPAKLLLRHDAVYPRSGDRPGQVNTIAFPSKGLPFPRLRDGVTHLYAAFCPGYRSQNPLKIRVLPQKGADGSPIPIRHQFILEPVEDQK